MIEKIYAVLALVPIALYFLYCQLWQYRFRRFSHIPNSLEPNIFVGHVGHMAAGFKRLGDSRAHPGTAIP